jgi:hypothetical protein
MFIGHFAVGFAAKRVAPRLSLAALFAAVALADVIWPVLVGLGIEQVRIDPGNTAFTPLDFISYPYSHSLVFLCLWGLVFGLICARIVDDRGTVPIAASGRWGFAGFVAFLLLAYFADIGSPPPGVTALVAVGIAGTAVLVLWAWWFDRHRIPVV